jgi:hypothetical protein
MKSELGDNCRSGHARGGYERRCCSKSFGSVGKGASIDLFCLNKDAVEVDSIVP